MMLMFALTRFMAADILRRHVDADYFSFEILSSFRRAAANIAFFIFFFFLAILLCLRLIFIIFSPSSAP